MVNVIPQSGLSLYFTLFVCFLGRVGIIQALRKKMKPDILILFIDVLVVILHGVKRLVTLLFTPGFSAPGWFYGAGTGRVHASQFNRRSLILGRSGVDCGFAAHRHPIVAQPAAAPGATCQRCGRAFPL